MGAAGNKKPKKTGAKHEKHAPAYELNEAKQSVASEPMKKKK